MLTSTPSKPVAWFLHALDSSLGREIAKELISAGEESGFPAKPEITWVPEGTWEDVTLNKVRAWSRENPDALVLYTHTKGALRQDRAQELWRGVMTDRLLRAWPARISDLQANDTSGVWWLTDYGSPYYAGNFWWANAAYIATLPELPVLTAETRFEAEAWIGRGGPRAKWISQEWPSFSVPTSPEQQI